MWGREEIPLFQLLDQSPEKHIPYIIFDYVDQLRRLHKLIGSELAMADKERELR